MEAKKTGFNKENHDDIDIMRLIFNLRKQKKIFLATVICGLVITFVSTASYKTYYFVEVEVSKPLESDAQYAAYRSLVPLNAQIMFDKFINKITSENNFREFLKETGGIEELFDDKVQEPVAYASNLFDSVDFFGINEGLIGGDDNEEVGPSGFGIKWKTDKQEIVADLLNRYLEYSNTLISQELKETSEQLKIDRIVQMEERIEFLLREEKQKRLRQIAIIEHNNEIAMATYEVELEALRKSALIKKNNELDGIAEAKEVADELDVERPTPLDDFRKSATQDNVTNIRLSSGNNLPLFLMGKKYLKVIEKNLKERSIDALNIERISQIEASIIKMVNDPNLAELKNRESDELFVDEIPIIRSEINKLNLNGLELDRMKLFSIKKSAVATNKKADKINKNGIIILGLFFSVVLGLFLALIKSAFATRSDA